MCGPKKKDNVLLCLHLQPLLSINIQHIPQKIPNGTTHPNYSNMIIYVQNAITFQFNIQTIGILVTHVIITYIPITPNTLHN